MQTFSSALPVGKQSTRSSSGKAGQTLPPCDMSGSVKHHGISAVSVGHHTHPLDVHDSLDAPGSGWQLEREASAIVEGHTFVREIW
jgi:hypothetical protein